MADKVFIVHGHDAAAKSEAESLVYRIGMVPVTLHRRANLGRTIIEKFEDESDVKFALVLLTPDDEIAVDATSKRYRARQNVIFELGYFFARLGRRNVVCAVKGDVERPSDIDGIVYVPFIKSLDEAEAAIAREFKHEAATLPPGDPEKKPLTLDMVKLMEATDKIHHNLRKGLRDELRPTLDNYPPERALPMIREKLRRRVAEISATERDSDRENPSFAIMSTGFLAHRRFVEECLDILAGFSRPGDESDAIQELMKKLDWEES